MRLILILFSIHFIAISNLSPALGQEDSTRSVRLEEILVQGNRINTPFDEMARSMHVMTAKKIRRLPVQSIPEALAMVPGVDIRQRGPLGIQADIGIRGGSFEQTLILINGIKLTDPQTGHHSLNLPLPLHSIDRIEVLKGPGARIFGQNAFSGAVNFITSVPDRRRISLNLAGGQYDTYHVSAGLSLPGKYAQQVNLSRTGSSGYRHNTDLGITNFFYQSEMDLKEGELEFMAGISDRKFGANGFYASPDYTEQYEEVRTALFSLGYRKRFRDVLINPRFYYRRNRDNYFFVRSDPDVYENLHVTQTSAFEVNASWWNALGESGIGLEYRKELIEGTWVRNGTLTESNLDGFDRDNFGVFLEHRFRYGKFRLTPGIYVNAYSDFGWNAFPGIDLSYQIHPDISIYGNIGRAFRIPTFYDMYYQSPVEKGNPDLNPEKSLSYEAGMRYLRPGLSFELNGYFQDAHELIDWVYRQESDSTYIWMSENFTDIKRNGIEIAASLDMKKLIHANFMINSLQFSYHFIHSDLLEKLVTTRYTLENIRHQLITGINHKVIWMIHHQFNARMIDREEMDVYWLLDSRIYWEDNRDNQVFIEITNLADTEYTEVMTPMPGRWIRAGLVYHFDF